jgi:hypothetical protein
VLTQTPDLEKQLDKANLSVEEFIKISRYCFMLLGLAGLVLVAHVGLTFKLMRQYIFLFEKKDDSNIV